MTRRSAGPRPCRALPLLCLLALLAPAAPLAAQALPFDLQIETGAVYAAGVPTPEQVIGHRVGTRHTRSDQLVEFFRAVAAASDRVTFGTHGSSYGGRPLVHAVVTSPANHARLEQIREANLRLSETPAAVADAALAGMPSVVYMGYSVHGNEASGSEAALLTLYHLAAGEGRAVQEVLDNVVVVIDPNLNPDGRARFADWVNHNRGRVATTDPQDREHNEPWPGGRTNHYFFDLNRDWLPAQHPESQGRLELFHRWRPQLHLDFHEMGGNATYFFQPGVPSRNNPNTPQRVHELTARVAEFHARALDRIGSLYYTRESFDDFYYGKGSTYPDVSGAIGILFEQASSRALTSETVFGELTYAFTVRNQFATSLSSLEAAVAMRETLLRHQRDFYREAADAARRSPVRAWVVSLEGDRTRAQALGQMLLRHRIRVHDLGREFRQDGQTFRPGQAFVVPVDQPQARLVLGAMERRFEFEDSLFYDVSTWTSPLAFGVRHAEVRASPAGLLGTPIAEMPFDGGAVVGGRASYAYVMEWGRYLAPRALLRLQQAGVQPLVSFEPFETTVAGERRAFGRGSIVVPVVQRDAGSTLTAERVHELVEALAREEHVVFHAVATGLNPSGVDLGSRSASVLRMPRVALLSGPGTRSNEVGEAWHLLNERFGIPVSLLDVAVVGRADLSRYNTIVMAGYGSGLAGAAAERLRDWVRGGGVLIATTSSVPWVLQQELVDERLREASRDTARVAYGDVEARSGVQQIGGSIFEVELDTTHPLAFGFDGRIPLFREAPVFLHPSRQPGANVGVYTADPLLSGHISARNLELIRGSAAIVARRAGSGRVVLFTDNPNFRAFWYGTNGLFLNAVFLGGTF
jgi:hypothetical protein